MVEPRLPYPLGVDSPPGGDDDVPRASQDQSGDNDQTDDSLITMTDCQSCTSLASSHANPNPCLCFPLLSNLHVSASPLKTDPGLHVPV